MQQKEIGFFTAGVLAASLLVGCASTSTTEATAKNHNLGLAATSSETHLQPCYDGPQNEFIVPQQPPMPVESQYKSVEEYLAALDRWNTKLNNFMEKWYTPKELRVPLEKSVNILQGDPIALSNPVENKIDNSIVKIETETGTGSGFEMRDAAGNKVIVTAQHVIGGAALGQVTISDNSSHVSHPTGGCYIFESKDSKHPALDTKKVQDLDIAILNVPKSIGNSSLKLAKNQPKRGNWVSYDNFQAGSEVGYPSRYNGLVVESEQSLYGLTALTGIEPFLPKPTDSTALAGCSGGVVTNQSGEVVGMSYAASMDEEQHPLYDSASNLKADFNVVFPGAQFPPENGSDPSSNFAPVRSDMQGMTIIEQALRSDRA